MINTSLVELNTILYLYMKRQGVKGCLCTVNQNRDLYIILLLIGYSCIKILNFKILLNFQIQKYELVHHFFPEKLAYPCYNSKGIKSAKSLYIFISKLKNCII